MKNNIKKIIFTTTLSLTFLLTGCNAEKSSNNGNNTGHVEPEKTVEKELTPLEKEISELKDFQMTDKVYDNKDLEPFNKMQGYYYSISRNGRDTIKLIDLTPPTKEGLAVLEADGEDYTLIGNVIIPCYFFYSEYTNEWEKRRPFLMDDIDFQNYKYVKPEYKYISDEELDKVFGREETEVERQFTIKK